MLRKIIPKNKKGDLQSYIILFVIVFTMAIIVLIFSKVFIEVLGELKTQPEIAGKNNTVQTITFVESKTIDYLDLLVFFSFIALTIGLFISCIFINTHPAILVVLIIGWIVTIFLGGIFSNVYSDLSLDTELSSTASQFTLTNIIMGKHLPIIVFAVGIIMIVILYGKSRSGEYGI